MPGFGRGLFFGALLFIAAVAAILILAWISEHPWVALTWMIGLPVAGLLLFMIGLLFWAAFTQQRYKGPPHAEIDAAARRAFLLEPAFSRPRDRDAAGHHGKNAAEAWAQNPSPGLVDYDRAAGTLTLLVAFSLREEVRWDQPATQSQIDAVRAIWTDVPQKLSFSQANALLSARNYARAVLLARYPNLSESFHDALVRYLVAFISGDEDLLERIMRWSRRRYLTNCGPARVERTSAFPAVFEAIERVRLQYLEITR